MSSVWIEMLSFVGFVSCMLALSSAFVVATPLSLARLDSGSKSLCAHSDEDISTGDLRRILIKNDFDSDRIHYRGFLDNEEDGEDRSSLDLEWKKIRRYIKRQLKVPKRYLKKIIRTLSKATSFRSDGDDAIVSLIPDAGESGNILQERSIGRFDTKRLLVVHDPESAEYFAIIAAPTKQIYQ